MSYHRKLGPKKRQRRDGSFEAVDGFGRSHVIEMYTELVVAQADGPQTLVTADGESVERLAKGRYRILHGGFGLTVTSDDVAAP